MGFLNNFKVATYHYCTKSPQKFKCKNPHRTIRKDQGKELGRSVSFQKILIEEGFHLELTGSDASTQNIITESPHKYLGNMM